MNIKYSRISKDDKLKSKYVSIENQNKIIDRYAAENGIVIDKSFEDDGITGYNKQRPAFDEIKLLIDENRVDTLIVKDLSRIGRHNASVLLFIERAKLHGVTVIAIDDNYNSATDTDGLLGLKTWMNEIQVIQTSFKSRNALRTMQESASLISKVPYGYYKDLLIKNKYHIDPNTSIYVAKIFNLYADGHGYKKIAKILNEMGAPTPSMAQHQRKINNGLESRIKYSTSWDGGMVKDIITNDFYIGVLRTRKSERVLINGLQKRLPEDQHFVFEGAHAPIIPKELFNMVHDLNKKRSNDSVYKGIRKYDNPYAGLLQCGDCGRALTISHYNKGEVISYACRNYRDKGVKYCSAHSVNKQELNLIVKDYLILCRAALLEMIGSLDSILQEKVKNTTGTANRMKALVDNIEAAKFELKTMMERKIKEISANAAMADIIAETYDKMQAEKLTSIDIMQTQLKEYENIDKNTSEIKKNFKSAIEIFDSILKSETLTNRQINILIDKIVVYDDNTIDIQLKGDLGLIFKEDAVVRMSKEDRIKRIVINYITSVSSFGVMKVMSEIRKTDSISYEKIQPLIQEFVDKGYVEYNPTARPPYICIASKKDMLDGFNICTDVLTINCISNLSTNLEIVIKISKWIQRYI